MQLGPVPTLSVMPADKHPAHTYRLLIGQNIRKWRMLKGIKQELLASNIGITKAALSNIENNKTAITLRRIEDIANCLDIEVMKLFSDPNDLLLLQQKEG